MTNELSSFFVHDHRRLEGLLKSAFLATGEILDEVYSEFRSGLLRHIALEEKILMPAIMKSQNGLPHLFAARLRLDHGAFAALLVPPPREEIKRVFLGIMHGHNELEESTDGLYAVCENLPQEQVQEMLLRIKEYPNVPVMPYSDKPNVSDAVRRAVSRAGYDYDQLTHYSISENNQQKD
jgi:hypothetical protein